MIIDRSKAPEFIIPETIQLLQPIERVLSNGLPLYYFHTPQLDAIRVEVISKANREWLHKEKELVPFFVLNMLMEGTKKFKSEELDNFFDHYASEVDAISTFEQSGLSILTTKKHFSNVMPLFSSLFTEAVFPEKELNKRKAQRELNISLTRQQTAARANQLLRRSLFGKDHPYGFIATEEDVRLVSQNDLKQYYETAFLTQPEIFVTGNLEEKNLEEIEGLFADLKSQNSLIPPVPFEPLTEKRASEAVEKSMQASIRLGQHLIPKSHPDYHAVAVFNTILGGYFGSRLSKNIREDKGYTYGIYSSLGSLDASDYWVVLADIQKGYADAVIEEVYKEIELLKTSPISLLELETAKNYMIGNFLSDFSSAFDLMNKFKQIHQHGLDYGFYEDQLRFIKSFTPEDVMRGGQYFKPEKMVEVVVGSL